MVALRLAEVLHRVLALVQGAAAGRGGGVDNRAGVRGASVVSY